MKNCSRLSMMTFKLELQNAYKKTLIIFKDMLMNDSGPICLSKTCLKYIAGDSVFAHDFMKVTL